MSPKDVTQASMHVMEMTPLDNASLLTAQGAGLPALLHTIAYLSRISWKHQLSVVSNNDDFVWRAAVRMYVAEPGHAPKSA